MERGYEAIFAGEEHKTLLYSFKGGSMSTMHNVLLQFVIEFGIGGLIFLILLFGNGYRCFKYALLYVKKQTDNQSWAFLSIFLLVFAILFSVLTTSKFPVFWFYAILFAFINLIYRHIREEALKDSSGGKISTNLQIVT